MTSKTIIYNCKHCKQGLRVEYPIEQGRGYFYRRTEDGTIYPAGVWIQSGGGGRPTLYGGDVDAGGGADAVEREAFSGDDA